MERLYQDYKDVAEFYIVYISEAHASDGRRPVPYAKELGIKEHPETRVLLGSKKRGGND